MDMTDPRFGDMNATKLTSFRGERQSSDFINDHRKLSIELKRLGLIKLDFQFIGTIIKNIKFFGRTSWRLDQAIIPRFRPVKWPGITMTGITPRQNLELGGKTLSG